MKEPRTQWSRLRNLVMSACLLTAPFHNPLQARADGDKKKVDVDKVEVSTPIYRPSFSDFDLPLGTYVYETSWGGIPAAEASVTVALDRENQVYRVTTAVRTYSAIDLLYKLRYTAEGTLRTSDLLPIKTVINQRENSKTKRVEINFLDDGTISAVRSQSGNTKTLTFNPNNFTLDPFAAAFLARSLKWEKGDTKSFDTFNGKTRYLIKLKAEDKIQMKVNGELRDVWVITPSVEKLTEPNSPTKLRDAKIYVTDDSARDILQIVSEVFIGSVTTQMESFTPAKPLRGMQVASVHHLMLE